MNLPKKRKLFFFRKESIEMKFQDPSKHGSAVTGGVKKCVVHTNTQAKSKMPHQFFQSWSHNYTMYQTALKL